MYKKSILTVLIIISCVLFLTLCKKEPTQPSLLIPITVGEGLKPQYSWTGGPVCYFLVYYADSVPVIEYAEGITKKSVLWGAKMEYGQDEIASPVVHGIRPAGSLRWDTLNMEVLPAGTGRPFLVKIVRVNGVNGSKVFSR